MRTLRYGDTGLLVRLDDPADILRIRAGVLGAVGVLDVVPAARTLLIEFDPQATSVDRLRDDLDRASRTSPVVLAPGDIVHITVRYDGDDLGDVARESGLSIEDVIARHAEPIYTVAFCGFSPGFAYCTGLDPVLHLPRLARPRTRVPAGSVGIAAEYTGIYPHPSPGGWRLLGRTTAQLWDLDRDPPALLPPGTTVRFTVEP